MKYQIIFKKFEELTNTELYEVLRLRSEVFVLEQTCLYPDMDNGDQTCIHALMYDGERIIAYLRILPSGQVFDTVAIGRVLVVQSERGRGAARRLLIETLKYIKDVLHEKHIKLSAQQYLIEFYESLGFNAISEGYLEDGIPHIDMELT